MTEIMALLPFMIVLVAGICALVNMLYGISKLIDIILRKVTKRNGMDRLYNTKQCDMACRSGNHNQHQDRPHPRKENR